MTHDEWRDLLHGFRDGELAGPEKAAVQGHLEACRECRLELERWERLAAGLLKPLPPASEGFVARVMAGIEDEERAAEPAQAGWWLAPSCALAAGLFLLLWSGTVNAPAAELLLLADGSDWVFSPQEPGPDDVLAEVVGERP